MLIQAAYGTGLQRVVPRPGGQLHYPVPNLVGDQGTS